jgi:hypothetical protein
MTKGKDARLASQDRARIVFDCRMMNDAASMASTISAHARLKPEPTVEKNLP